MKKLESSEIHNIGAYYYSGLYSGYKLFNGIMFNPFKGKVPIIEIISMKI